MATAKKAPAHIKDLVPDPTNRRVHTQRNIGMIVDSLHAVGAARSIVIDETNEVLAGNGVLEAAGEAGITKVQTVDVDGDTIVAVRRRGLSATQKRSLALYDNRAAELAEWNTAQLQADYEAGLDLSAFFTQDETADLLGQEPKAGLTDPDAVPEPRATDIQPGDLFELGDHRLLCGDSTKAEDVARVMGGERSALVLTDPPYGIKRSQGFGGFGGFGPPIARRRYTDTWDTERPPQVAFDLILDNGRGVIIFGGNYFADRLPPSTHWIVWDKRNTMPSFGDCELAWTNSSRTSVKKYEVKYNGLIGKEAERYHPTQKPVALFAAILSDYSEKNESVLDSFCGSGTTLIAAEQLGRKCYAIEIEPSYCQVTIDRWEQFTGQKAEKVGELTPA